MKLNKVEAGIVAFLVFVVIYLFWQLLRAPV